MTLTLEPIVIEPSEIESKKEIVLRDIAELKLEIENFKIEDESTFEQATDLLGKVKMRLNKLEVHRKKDTQGLNATLKQRNSFYKWIAEPLFEGEKIIKNLVKQYLDEQHRKAEAEAERVRKEQEEKENEERLKAEKARAEEERLKKEAEEAKSKKQKAELEKRAELAAAEAKMAEKNLQETEMQIIEEPKKSIRTSSGLVSRKLKWTWTVTDKTLLKKTCPELFILDEKEVNRRVQEGARNIPGLRIFQDSEIAMKV